MNIFDYCRWRGDITFRVDPFNEVDNMCLAQMTYTVLDKYFKQKDKWTIKELSEAYFAEHSVSEVLASKSLFKFSPIILKEMAETERFSDVIVYNYVSKLHEDNAEQFAAMMFDLRNGYHVVAFRGTDDTVVGWKEDLMLSYGDISSQFDALEYINDNFKLFNRYYIIGHSKGGYLATYAAVKADKMIRNSIMRVYSNDGPGLRKETLDQEDEEFLKEKYLLIVPENDGIGTIYEMPYQKKIAKISANNIVSAHSMLTWQVERNRIVEAEKHHYESDLTRKVIVDFLKETSIEQREFFVKELFEGIEEAGISNITQFSEGGFPLILKALSKLMEMDDAAKEVGLKMMKTISKNLSNDIQNGINEGSSSIKYKTTSSIEKLLNKYLPKKKPD